MDLENLQTFIKVAETKSFSRSAEALNVTQPAISKRIAALESSLDKRLFDRAGRTVHLTEAGRVLLPGAKQIQLEIARVEDELSGSDGKFNSSLNLGTTNRIATTQLSTLLTKFRQSFNDVKIELIIADPEEIIDQISNDSLELAICPFFGAGAELLPDSLLSTTLITTSLKFVVSKDNPLAFESAVTPAQLSTCKAILPKAGTLARRAIDAELSTNLTDADVSVSADEFGTMRSLATMGMGWTCLPEHFIGDQLVVLNVAGINLYHTLTLVRRRNRTLSRAADAFLGRLPIDTSEPRNFAA